VVGYGAFDPDQPPGGTVSALPPLPESWEPTRATLHAYARAVGAVARRHAIGHPKWWHVSLEVQPNGLVTDSIPLPGGGAVQLRMDLTAHQIVVESSDGASTSVPMNAGLTGTEVGDALTEAIVDLGLSGDLDRSRFENGDPRTYDDAAATLLFNVLVDAATLFERHRAAIEGPVSPVQLWPHGFDLAMEWYGARTEAYEEHGEVIEHPSQVNLGFYPGGDPYFYSNPWPFEGDQLLPNALPGDADWHTEGWEGTKYPYALLVADDDWERKVADYARVVHELAAPTLA
jgi:hypothetical protein